MSKDLVLFLSMLAGGVLTFAARAVFLVSGERFGLGPRFRQFLSYVPPAVLAALIAPEIFIRDGSIAPLASNPRLWAAALAVLIAIKTRNVLATIALGMLALWGLQSFL